MRGLGRGSKQQPAHTVLVQRLADTGQLGVTGSVWRCLFDLLGQPAVGVVDRSAIQGPEVHRGKSTADLVSCPVDEARHSLVIRQQGETFEKVIARVVACLELWVSMPRPDRLKGLQQNQFDSRNRITKRVGLRLAQPDILRTLQAPG